MKQKFTSTIAGASIIISLLGLVSRSLGFLREMMFAAYFGLGPEFDLYLVGGVLPVTINFIILYIGQNYFVPGFQKINSSDPDAAQKYLSQTFNFFIVGSIIITFVLFFTSEFVINLYVHSASMGAKNSAIEIFRIFLITIPFSTGISILTAYLQAIYEFKYPSISTLLLNLSIITLVFIYTNKFGVYIIPFGYVVGTILQFCYLIFKAKKNIKINFNVRSPRFTYLSTIASASLLMIVFIESLSQLYPIFDRYFYESVSPGGIASLSYGMTIWFLPISLFSISLATAVFPKITKEIINSSHHEIERIYNDSISMNIFILMPLSFILFFEGDTIIKIFFERGRFLQESTQTTFEVLKYYSLSLVFYSIYSVFNKMFYSLNLIRVILYITITATLIKLMFNFLLIDLQQNGLALSTSISYFIFFLLSYLVLNIKLKIKNKSLVIKEFIFHLINCGMSYLITISLTKLLHGCVLMNNIFIVVIFLLIYSVNIIFINHNAILILKSVLTRLTFLQQVLK